MKILEQFDKATDDLAKEFVEKYFGEGLVDDDYFWVGSQDEDREVLCVNDDFFNLEDIVRILRYDYNTKQVLEFYDNRLDKK